MKVARIPLFIILTAFIASALPTAGQVPLRIAQCPGDQYLTGNVCWKTLTRTGEGSWVTDLVRERTYGGKAIALIGQNWEVDNDDMVGVGCTVEYAGSLIRGRLTMDWYAAEYGVGQCTFLYFSPDYIDRCPHIGGAPPASPLCWATLMRMDDGEEIELFPFPPSQYPAVASMSQVFDGGLGGHNNDDAVGLQCTVEEDPYRFVLRRDSAAAEPGVSECSFLAFSPQILGAECPGGAFTGDVCWKKLIMYWYGIDDVPLIYDPLQWYVAFGFISQKEEYENDDFVGMKCTTYRSAGYIFGKLEKDWYAAEPGDGECTYLVIKKQPVIYPATATPLDYSIEGPPEPEDLQQDTLMDEMDQME
jgi:hypothetical protein